MSWDNSISTNVKEYEIWKSPSVALQKNNVNITNDLLNTGVIYLNEYNEVAGDPWTTGSQELIGTISYPATILTITGVRQETGYFWIRAVIKENNKSKFANSVTGVKETLGTINTNDIDSLAVTNAKIADLAVDNAKIANLYANKIRSETISGQTITIGPSGGTPGSVRSENFIISVWFCIKWEWEIAFKG